MISQDFGGFEALVIAGLGFALVGLLAIVEAARQWWRERRDHDDG